jgi:hypothetical protein
VKLPALASDWSAAAYGRLRAVFGLWLAFHFAHLLPWCAELFSSSGVIADGTASPFLQLFPNLFLISDAPGFVLAVHLAATAAGLMLALGKADRAAAVFLWYVLACQFGRNPLMLNPALPYVGLLLLAHALQPRARAGAAWRRDPRLFALLWILMAAGYTFSGLTKLASPSWLDGSALAQVLDNPLARDAWPREALLALPDGLLRAATWAALGLELAFAPLALLRRTRRWVWLAMVTMHLALIVLVDFADLTAGMLFLHAFTWDPAWLRRRQAACEAGALPAAESRGASSSSSPGKPRVQCSFSR